MNLLFPSFQLQFLPRMLGIALMGMMLSGMYGVLHDQITYSISPEYFTRLKFFQFQWANIGLPPRLFVGEIGFLATWWVGFFSAWFLARIAVPAWPIGMAVRRCLAGFGVIFILAFIAGVIGFYFGVRHSGDYSSWKEICLKLGVTDVPAFVRVAYIHNAGYVGGLVGLIVAIIFLTRSKRNKQDLVASPILHN